MIDKLIDKYKAKLKYITDLKNKTSFELVRVSCLEKEFIVKEIIQDLEELKEKINNLDITSINAPSIVITQMLKNEIIGVDIDE